MKKFWDWIRDEDEGRILRLEGPIDSDNFWGDEITPQSFRSELEAEDGDLTIFINSPGGNVFAAAEIYTMIKEYPHNVTVKIASIAASAASVVAMAGDRVLMSPTALLMVHDPMTIAMGNKKDFERAIDTLNEVKESIINAYRTKTGMSRNKIAELMEDETWMNAKKAVELGFADEVLYQEKPASVTIKSVGPEKDPDEDPDEDPEKENEDPEEPEEDDPGEKGPGEKEPEEEDPEKEKRKEKGMSAIIYKTRIMNQAILNSISGESHDPRAEPEEEAPTVETDVVSEENGDSMVAPTEEVSTVETVETSDEDLKPTAEPEEESRATEADIVSNEAHEGNEEPKEEIPVIGMDGRTKDGAMPFEILINQLNFLK